METSRETSPTMWALRQGTWLFVVKKNASVLRNLISWVEERVADAHDAASNRPIVRNLPLLVIDDEADHASVDTGEQEFDENGQPDPDYEPNTINRLIRRLLYLFDKSADIRLSTRSDGVLSR